MQIFVLGMHRSGTSPLTRILNMMGAYVGMEGSLMEPHTDNPKGFWERNDVYALHQDILKATGASWHEVAQLDLGQLSDQDRAAFEKRARTIIQNLDAHRPWVMKDPRLCLLLSLWQSLLEAPVYVHIYRSPLQVAQSLRTRNGFPIHFGAALWEKYNLTALTASQSFPRLFVSHQRLLAQPLETVRALYEQLLALDVQGLRLPSEREILAFIDPALYHERGDAGLKKEFINFSQEALFQTFEEETVGDFNPLPSLSAGAREALEQHEIEEKRERQWVALEQSKTTEVATLQQRLMEAEQTRVALEQSKTTEVATLQQRLTEAEQTRVTEVQALQQQKTEADRALATAYERLLALVQSKADESQALQQKLAGAEQALAVANERLLTFDQKINESQALQQKLAGAEQALAAARERLFALEQSKIVEGQALQQKLAGTEQALAVANERLLTFDQKISESQALQQKLAGAEQALAAVRERLFALEQSKIVEGQALQQKLIETERLLADKQQQLSVRTTEVHQYVQDSAQLSRWIGLFDRCFVSVLNSKRWQLGHALAAFFRKIRFKPPLPMPQESWESIMKEFTAWKKAREAKNRTGQLPSKPASGPSVAVLPALALQGGKGSLVQPATKTSLAPARNEEKERPR